MTETDTIPRLENINYLFATLRAISSNGMNFEGVRKSLLEQAKITSQQEYGVPRTGYSTSRRLQRARASDAYTYWTNARDAIRELITLGFVETAPVPSKKDYVNRHRATQYKLTGKGDALIQLVRNADDSGFRDSFFQALYFAHPYLRTFLGKLAESELFVPVFTSGKVDKSRVKTIESVVDDFLQWFSHQKAGHVEMADYVGQVREYLEEKIATTKELNTRKLVGLLNETAQRQFLSAYGLHFDNITFDHLVKLMSQFWVINYSYSVPSLDGLVVYSTAEITRNNSSLRIDRHRLADCLADILKEIPLQFIRIGKSFVPIHELRAAVCYKLRINDQVFDAAIRGIHQGKSEADYTITLLTDLTETLPPSSSPLRIGDKSFYTLTLMRKEARA